MLDEKAPVTLYYQLKNIIIDKINSNEWPVNTKIPTERQLCEMYNVSRITVRQSIEKIERDGYLYRKQGKGTFVTLPKLEQRLSNFYSFSEEIKKMGYIPGSKILLFTTTKANDTIADNLSIDKGTLVYMIKRLRLASNEPFAVEISYIPYYRFKDLQENDISSNGLYNTLKQKYKVNPDEATETFEAVLINSEESGFLQIKKNSPGLLLERLTYAGGKTVEYCKSVIRGDRYKYKVILK